MPEGEELCQEIKTQPLLSGCTPTQMTSVSSGPVLRAILAFLRANSMCFICTGYPKEWSSLATSSMLLQTSRGHRPLPSMAPTARALVLAVSLVNHGQARPGIARSFSFAAFASHRCARLVRVSILGTRPTPSSSSPKSEDGRPPTS